MYSGGIFNIRGQEPDARCFLRNYSLQVSPKQITAKYTTKLPIGRNKWFFLVDFRLLVEQLERVDLSMSEDNIKLAFWINVYNSLIMHVMPDIIQ
jgi:hypothetical protein